MKTLMRSGRDRRSENPRSATREKNACCWLGPISGSHQGQRPQRLHSKAGYMAAPERFAKASDSFPLHRGRRPYMALPGKPREHELSPVTEAQRKSCSGAVRDCRRSTHGHKLREISQHSSLPLSRDVPSFFRQIERLDLARRAANSDIDKCRKQALSKH